MCSLNDCDGNCESLISSEKFLLSENPTCRSCSSKGLVILRKKDIYCQDCFLATAVHKFRAALGKSKLMQPQDRVLVAYSGSQSSAALLHLLHSGVTESKHKKLLYNVLVLYVEEGALFNIDLEEREKSVHRIKSGISAYDFPVFISSLSESLEEFPIFKSSLITNKENDKKLIDLFDNIKSFSSKEDLLNLLRQKLILKVAEQLNCSKVFTAEVGTDVAIKLLSNFSLGRGATASFDSGFCDSRHPHIKILRPLRDFIRKEIIFYNKFQNVEAVYTPSFTTKLSSNVSIQKLTEKFVTELQEEFPSTVYTIFRTGEKLNASTVDDTVIDNVCVLCKDKIRTSKNRSSYAAVEAFNFSRNVSSKELNNCSKSREGDFLHSCSAEKKAPEFDAEELENRLCYGCALIIRDMKKIDVLPQDTLLAAAQKNNFEIKPEKISELSTDNSSQR